MYEVYQRKQHPTSLLLKQYEKGCVWVCVGGGGVLIHLGTELTVKTHQNIFSSIFLVPG